jgi:Protein kinase domain
MTEAEESWVGQTLAGKYRVERILGKGGMGLVFAARHIKLDEPVAIKLLRPAMMEVDGMVGRFLREARAASKIKSPHVVRVTDVDVLPDGAPYMVMEHLNGIDFFDLRVERERLGVLEAVGYVLQACDAIAEAHSLGIVHRDLKPSNLFLHRRPDGKQVVKVLDFGLSKVEAPGELEATRSGQILGSPKYMSPEQMLSMRDVDGRADIWSIGVILYELLTGRPPFVADTTPRLCALVLNAEPAPASSLRADLPPVLDRIIMRCLHKDRAQRFANVAELAAALAPFAPAETVMKRTGTSTRMLAVSASVTPAPITIGPPSTRPEPAAEPAKVAAPPVAPPAVAAPEPAAPQAPGPEAVSAPNPPATRRIAVALAAAAVVVVLGAIYLSQRGGSAVAASAGPPAGETAAPAPASLPVPTVSAAPAQALKPGLNPDDLPEVVPTAAPAVSAKAGAPGTAPGSFARKPKPEPSSDPFGGRRH